jgi:hypothetical protein
MAVASNNTGPKPRDDCITLDFDGHVVSPDDFKRAAGAFVDLLKEVSDQVCGRDKKLRWNMRVAEGSLLLNAFPLADLNSSYYGGLIAETLQKGFIALNAGSLIEPPYFTEKALKAARDLASLRDEKGIGVKYVRVRFGSYQAQELTSSLVDTVDRIMGRQHQAFGSVEGKLQTISERGLFQFVVYDSLFGKGVNCFVDDKMTQDAIAAFGKRVIVSGLVQYDRENRPISIRASSLRLLRDPKQLPSIKELRGILKET